MTVYQQIAIWQCIRDAYDSGSGATHTMPTRRAVDYANLIMRQRFDIHVAPCKCSLIEGQPLDFAGCTTYAPAFGTSRCDTCGHVHDCHVPLTTLTPIT